MPPATLHLQCWVWMEPAMPAAPWQEGQAPGMRTHTWHFTLCWEKPRRGLSLVGCSSPIPFISQGEGKPMGVRVMFPTSTFPFPPVMSSNRSRAQQPGLPHLKTPIPVSKSVNLAVGRGEISSQGCSRWAQTLLRERRSPVRDVPSHLLVQARNAGISGQRARWASSSPVSTPPFI